jgi:tRNA-specific 2-thiouridylase
VFYDAPTGQARVLGGGFIKSATPRSRSETVAPDAAPALVAAMRG